jgi:hypothetical protein
MDSSDVEAAASGSNLAPTRSTAKCKFLGSQLPCRGHIITPTGSGKSLTYSESYGGDPRPNTVQCTYCTVYCTPFWCRRQKAAGAPDQLWSPGCSASGDSELAVQTFFSILTHLGENRVSRRGYSTHASPGCKWQQGKDPPLWIMGRIGNHYVFMIMRIEWEERAIKAHFRSPS